MSSRIFTGAAAFAGLVLLGTTASEAQQQPSLKSAALNVGIVRSLFRDAPDPLAKALTEPLGWLIKLKTGQNPALASDRTALQLGQDLESGKIQIGVFQGIEFAWAKQKYPNLKPLVIVTDGRPFRRAYLVVNAKSAVHNFADLKGPVAMPLFSHEQCYAFARRACRQEGIDPKRILEHMRRPENSEDALDDVVDGSSPAAIVEEMALQNYRDRKPGRFTCLRIAMKSPKFPASVVAYRPGALSPMALRSFRAALLNAGRNTVGRQVLALWRLTGFEPVPAEYEKSLQEIVREYPAPGSTHLPAVAER